MGHVVVGAPGHRRADLCHHLAHVEAAHVTAEVMRVSADVAQHQRGTQARGVEVPVALALVRFHQRCPLRLDVFQPDLADRAQHARADHLARLADHGVGAVVVGQAEDQSARLDPLEQGQRIGEAGRQRLFADHVEAGVERCERDRHVAVVRGHDRHRLDRVAPVRFALEHGPPVGVGALLRQSQAHAGGPRPAGSRGQRSRDDLEAVVEPRCRAVDRADHRTRAAAHQPQPKPAAVGLDGWIHERSAPCPQRCCPPPERARAAIRLPSGDRAGSSPPPGVVRPSRGSRTAGHRTSP